MAFGNDWLTAHPLFFIFCLLDEIVRLYCNFIRDSTLVVFF